MVVAMGRTRACSSPSKVTGALPSAASSGTNRMTVPASPQSIVAGSVLTVVGGVTVQVMRVALDRGAERRQRRGHEVGVA